MLANLFILFLLQISILILLNKFAYKLDFLDYPNKRKTHIQPTPYVGGLTIGISYLFITYLINIESFFIDLIIFYGILISLVGIIDDKFDINPISKLILQSIPVCILISKGLYLNDIGEYEIIGKIYLGNYNLIFTFLCSLLIINAFNYLDGVDGLLSSIFINICSSFMILCYLFDELYMSQLFIYFIFPVFIFFLFNISFLKLPKIFLGDSGSTLLGFLTGFLMIFLYSKLNINPSLLIWPVGLIIYDFLSTNILRILKKKNVFSSGTDHIHYQISKKFNLNVFKLNLLMNILNYLITLLGIVIYFSLGSFFSLIGFILLFFLYLCYKLYLVNKISL